MKSKAIFFIINLIAISQVSAFDFAVECLSSSINLVQGFGGITSAHLSLISGPPQTVKMTAANLPSGVSVVFSPSDIPFDREGGAFPYTSIATVKVITSVSAPTGTHTITFTGTGGGVTKTTSLKLQITPLWAKGKIYYVSTAGNDSNAGTLAQPFRTIQHGSDVSAPGDVIVAKAGEYRERIKVKNSGLKGIPITFLGEPGATINAAQKVTGWQPAPEIASGVYKKPVSELPIYPGIGAITWKGKYCMWLLTPSPADGVGNSMDLLKMSNGYMGMQDPWSVVGAFGFIGYENNAQMAYVRFATNQSPDNENVEFAPIVPTFSIDAKNYIVVSGFTICNGNMQVEIKNQACGNIIEHNSILGTGGITHDRWAMDNVIRNNEITMNFYNDNIGHPINATAADYFLYILNRKYLNYIQYAVNVSAGNLQVYENHIYRHFSGLKMGHSFPGSIRIFRNYIHHICAYSLDQVSKDTMYVHDNLVYEHTHAWRIDDAMSSAVMYVYRNRFGILSQQGTPGVYGGGDGINCRTEFPSGEVKMYWYHNSFNDGPLTFGGGGLPNLWFINNIFSNLSSWIFWENDWYNYQFHLDYNWCGGNYSDALQSWLSRNHNKMRQNIRMWDAANPSFVPASDAKTMGIDLSKTWSVDGIQNAALPGMNPGYFSGGAPDAGAWVENNLPPIPAPGINSREIINSKEGLGVNGPVNPFFQPMNIQYTLHKGGHVQFEICNSFGQVVQILDSGEKPKGIYNIKWEKRNGHGEMLPNGVYYYRLVLDRKAYVKKVMVIR